MSAPQGDEHLLPSNATALERALSASDARMLSVPHQIIRWAWDIDLCPVHLLPYLAQAWSVDEWDPAWSDAQKRQVIHDSVWIHQHKGTIGALKRAIAQLGLGAQVERWFEQSPRGRPYTFRLLVALDPTAEWTSTQFQRLIRVAINNKAVRSWIDRVAVSRPTPALTRLSIGVAIVARVTLRNIIEPVRMISPPRGDVYVGVATVVTIRTRLIAI